MTQEWTGRDDLGTDAARRRKRRAQLVGHRPGSGDGPVVRKPVERNYGTTMPVSGSDDAKMLVAAQEPWECRCGRTLRFYKKRCVCGGQRPW